MVVSLDGLDALVAKLEQFSRIKMKAFREAATAAGKIIRAAMRAEIDAKTGGKRTISVQEMSDKAREQVANGSVNIRRLRTKAEKEGPLTEQELEWLFFLRLFVRLVLQIFWSNQFFPTKCHHLSHLGLYKKWRSLWSLRVRICHLLKLCHSQAQSRLLEPFSHSSFLARR